jgi:hypothetical protein
MSSSSLALSSSAFSSPRAARRSDEADLSDDRTSSPDFFLIIGAGLGVGSTTGLLALRKVLEAMPGLDFDRRAAPRRWSLVGEGC